MSNTTPALIAAMVALVAAGIVFFGALITKDLKITEFRQAWINDQRKDLATLVAAALKIARSGASKKSLSGDLRQFDEAAERIVLRENPKKKEWAAPLASIAKLRGLMLSAGTSECLLEVEIALLRRASQALMKEEWDRVREGEPTYRHGRAFVQLVMSVVGIALFMAVCAIGYGKGFIVLGRP